MSKNQKETVVILHGIGMSAMRMLTLEWGLRHYGYAVINLSYPSLRKNIATCARIVAKKIDEKLKNKDAVTHIVTHSMGGLVAMELLQQNLIKNPGRIVMVAPPFGGSEVADLLAQNFFYRHFYGPAGQELTTAHRKPLRQPAPKGLEIGIIAGSRAYEYPFFLSTMRPAGVHDGLVSLDSTRIEGLKDHITIRTSHSFLIELSASQAAHFLKHGCFNHKNQA